MMSLVIVYILAPTNTMPGELTQQPLSPAYSEASLTPDFSSAAPRDEGPLPNPTTSMRPLPEIKHLTLSAFYDNQWVMRTDADFLPKVKQMGNLTRPRQSAPPSFYKGNRGVPSLDWVEVFLRSVAHHTFGSPRPLSASTPQPLPGAAAFFVDPYTAVALSGRVQDLVSSGFLVLVAVCPPSLVQTLDVEGRVPPQVLGARSGVGPMDAAVSFGAALRVLRIPVVSPGYLEEEWVTGVPNGANNFRFALYLDYLAVEGEHVGLRHMGRRQVQLKRLQVLIADSTDVALQANPFLVSDLVVAGNEFNGQYSRGCFPPAAHDGSRPALSFTLESGTKTFRNEKYNRRWMSCYDKEGAGNMLRRMEAASAPISCAGVTLGVGHAVQLYLTQQVAELRKPALVACAASEIKATLDQATHNVLMFERRKRFQAQGEGSKKGDRLAKQVEEADSLVRLTRHETDHCTFHGNFGKLRLVPRSSALFLPSAQAGSSSDMVAVNAHNVPYLLVHQYSSNRHPPLMKVLKERYLGKA